MLSIEDIYEYCMAKPGAEEAFPFDENVLVFKVGGKMFGLTNINQSPLSINLKCDPNRAIELREQYESVIAGYHMSKKHWNTISLNDSDLPQRLILELIDHSYDLVYASLTKKIKAEIDEVS